MTTLELTPRHVDGAVTLEITKTVHTVDSVIRYDTNGITEVRTAEGQLPSAGAGVLILDDYEAAHGDVAYVVQAHDNMISEPLEVHAETLLLLDAPWLGVPVLPQYSEPAQTITVYTSDRASGSTEHRVDGRPDPLVALGRLRLRTGTFGIVASSYSQARRLEAVADRGEIMLLRQRVAGLDMYFTARSSGITAVAAAGEEDTFWQLTFAFAEVRRPAGNLAGAVGWTFDALAVDYDSFDAVAAAFDTFDDLTLNEPAGWVQ